MTRTLTPHNRRRGFTLVEVLVVLAILVTLAGLAAPRILKYYKQSNISTAKIQIGNIKQAVDAYYVDVKSYPSTEQGLQALVEKPSDLDDSIPWGGDTGKGYLDAVPNDPWNHPYQYAYDPGTDDVPQIHSLGPDGQDGTADDVTLDKTSGDSSGGTTGGSSTTSGGSNSSVK